MSYKRKLAEAVLKLSKTIFYDYTYELLLFMLTLTIFKIIQVMYKVNGFNYVIAIGLYFIGVLIYKISIRFFILTKRRILVLAFIVVPLAISILIFRKEVVRYVYLLMENNSLIQTAFYNSEESYFYQYLPFLILLIPLVTAVALYVESKGLDNILLFVTMIYIFNLWYAGELREVKAFIVIYIVIASLSYGRTTINYTIRKLEAQGIKSSVNYKKILQHILVLSCAVGIFAAVSVQTFGVNDVFTRIQEKRERSKVLLEKNYVGRYTLSPSGYPDSSVRLGGPVALNYSKAFLVQADEPHYLKGSTKDFYDGFRWTKTEEKYNKLSELPMYNKTRSFESAQERKLIIYPENLKVSTLFAPIYTFNIRLSKGEAYGNITGDFMIVGEEKSDKQYTLEFYDTEKGLEFFSRAYRNNTLINYEADGSNVRNKYSAYLQLPDNISEETYSLVKDIIKECRNSSEKVKAIQTYLSQQYKYSLDVSQPPKGKEFVGYFLFSEKKGYCTYFATAATIMFRIAGIPARYVEGFNMTDKKQPSGLYEVTNDMAHAWTEVLLNSDEDIWSIVDAAPGAEKDTASLDQSLSGSRSGNNGRDESTNSSKRFRFQYISMLNPEKALIWIFLLIPAGVVICSIFKIIIFLKQKKRILNSSSTIPLYYYIRKRIKFFYEGNRIPEDDLQWIAETNDGELKDKLRELVAAVYDEFYGKRTEVSLDKFKIYSFVESYVGKRQSKIKYFVQKFFNR